MIQYNDISIDCNSTKIHIDLTGGWKSALLLYMCAKDIIENQPNDTSIAPCVITRINRYNHEDMHRPDAVAIVEKQLAWIKNTFPAIKIDPILSIPADFWWLVTLKNITTSIDVSEKALLRHVYKLCTDDLDCNKTIEVISNRSIIKSFNAFCIDSSRIAFNEHILTIEQKKYQYGTVLNSNTVSLCNGDVIAVQPFKDTTKSRLVRIATELGILKDLNNVSYTCEQSTNEIIEACGQCFNCKQMKRAITDND